MVSGNFLQDLSDSGTRRTWASKHLSSHRLSSEGGQPYSQALCPHQQQSDITLQGLSRLDSWAHVISQVMFSPVLTCVWCLTLACPDTAFGHRPGLAGTPSPVPVPTHTGFSIPTLNRALVITGVLCRAQVRTNPPSPVPFRLFKMHKKPNLG